MRTPPRPRPVLVAALVLAATLFVPGPSSGQTCWAYVDDEPAMPGIDCVQKSDLTTPCAWPQDCTTVPSGGSQTMLRMHTLWHQCFGNVGGASPPPGRGQRWYAFHRQFEFDFNLWRMDRGYDPIEQHDWCPDMNLPVGHYGADLDLDPDIDHPADCGEGPGRPANTACTTCVPMPRCAFHAGAGPIACPSAPDASCQAPPGPSPTVTLPHASLDEFPDVDEISLLLDAYFHGKMHEAVSDGDLVDWDPPRTNNDDCADPDCSPRDPMFWRLHKALDDVVRAWQDSKAVDVMIVMDRSGSMSGADASGVTKLEAAVDAADYFADLLEDGRTDGQSNRIGLVTYSSSASLELPLTPVDGTLRDPGEPFPTALDAIESAGPGGCTGIGAGIERALQELCAGGDCRTNPTPPAPGTNARKAVLLLTDGLENRPPCLQPDGPTGGGACGSQCFGPQLAFENLEFTQLVGVGFGSSGSLNGDLLTLLAERQGGIYVQNPNGPDDDLKYFYAMAFGQLTDEFLLVDPRGHLPAEETATPPVEYGSCGNDGKLTFTAGWQRPTGIGDLRLLVNAPSGDLVRAGEPDVEASADSLWSTLRVRLPRRGEADGTWRAQLVRPHRQFVNGFASDVFPRHADGIRIVRRQIQRLCPDGCRRVLFFEKGRVGGASAYRDAVKLEEQAGLLGDVTAATDAGELTDLLAGRRWDLIVYSRMGRDAREPYDDALAQLLCRGQRAVVTDTRLRSARRILRCAGVQASRPVNWTAMEGDGHLFDGVVKLANPGHEIATVALETSRSVQATALGGQVTAVAATADSGRAHNWFVDVLGWGLGKISPVRTRLRWSTGGELVASARILPAFHRAGGWDHVDARVEVEYPRIGLGSLLAERGRADSVAMEGEVVDGRAAALAGLQVPTRTAVFPLYDDGTHGDLNPGNGHWTAVLPGLGSVDGMYRFRYMFDLTAGGCTTRREANHSMFVDVGVDGKSSDVDVTPVDGDAVRGRVPLRVDLRPADVFGNLLGPGRAGDVSCGPGDACLVRKVADHGDGSYTADLLARPELPGVRLKGFGAELDVAVPCEDCVRLDRVVVSPRRIEEHGKATLAVRLTGRALALAREARGTIVYLSSSDPRVAVLPDSVVVPAGRRSLDVPVEVRHLHDEPRQVSLSAHFGGEARSDALFVRPAERDSPHREQVAPSARESTATPPSPGDPVATPTGETGSSPSGAGARAAHPGASLPARPASDAAAVADPRRLAVGPALGSEEAPVVVVEFSDYGCPYCRSFHQATFPDLAATWVETGRVRWVVRDFPIPRLHPNSVRAAEAAACADEQGKLSEMRRALFAAAPHHAPGRLLEMGAEVTADDEAFEACLLERRHHESVRRSRAAGDDAGVVGTPTFFVLARNPGSGGLTVSDVIRGAAPPARFEEALDRALADAGRAAAQGY